MAGLSDARRNELVVALFDKHYECIVAPIYVDAIDERPISIQKESVPVHDYTNGVVHSVVNPNADVLMDAMFGRTRYTGDAERDNELANTPVDKLLTPVEMAEILAINGTFVLKEINKSTIIVEDIYSYVNGIEQQATLEPFYPKPPQQDLDKLTDLANKLQPLADRINLLGLGTGIWADLMAALDVTGTYEVGGVNNDFKIERKESPKPNTSTDTTSKDPYSF